MQLDGLSTVSCVCSDSRRDRSLQYNSEQILAHILDMPLISVEVSRHYDGIDEVDSVDIPRMDCNVFATKSCACSFAALGGYDDQQRRVDITLHDGVFKLRTGCISPRRSNHEGRSMSAISYYSCLACHDSRTSSVCSCSIA